ncbi:MAG: RNA 2',3'-cyclic phosphodiesterase [Bacteroidota bacterium]
MATENGIRLFLGIPLSEETRDSLEEVYGRYASEWDWKWTSPELYHITVYFFGEVPVERLPNMIALLQLALKDGILPPFVFDRYTYAPSKREARMLWAKYHKTEAFKLLVQKIHNLYQQIDPKIQIRKSPIPHVTLARFREKAALTRFPIQKLPPPPNILPVNQIILWKSVLMASGPKYEEIVNFPLSSFR